MKKSYPGRRPILPGRGTAMLLLLALLLSGCASSAASDPPPATPTPEPTERPVFEMRVEGDEINPIDLYPQALAAMRRCEF